MDTVKAFNSELQSLYDSKPPISKAKMTLITRSAMKAIKFYKHVVQSVEKFIQKCKPEYKVPGLYVIDSIVRQSRHQYSAEKDVFAPRFSRNIKTTFHHLFNCSQEDKSKIVRVLNLWQKNNVFTPDVIQPLLDLASSVANKDTVSSNGVQAKTPPTQPRTPNSKNSPAKDPAWLTGGRNQTTENNSDAKSASAAAPKVKMDKKLFDYDYGEDDDDDRAASASPIRNQAQSTSAQQTPLPNLDSLSSILSNPEVLRQLHTLQQQMAARQQQQELEDKMRRLQEMKHQEEEFDRHLAQTLPKLPFADVCEMQTNLTVSGVKSAGGLSLPSGVPVLPTSVPPPNVAPTSVPPPSGVAPPTGVPLPGSDGTPTLSLGANMPTAFLSQIDLPPLMVQPPPVPPPSFSSQPNFPSLDSDRGAVDYDERTRSLDLNRGGKDDGSMEEGEMNDDSIEVIDLVRSPSTRDSDHRRYRNRSRSKDRYRRSRSHSRSRRRRSRSSDRDSRDDRDRDYDRKPRDSDREKEKERKRKGLPTPRRNHLTVCSTTLWIGHLSKLIHEDQLSNIFGEYGDIVSINLIPPRGCAFVCMNRRQDAMKALHELKHYKIQSKSITVAWAPGKGMKEKEWKDYWEVEHGASFIPWNKLNPKTNFELLEEGGMLDQDTFPDWLKETYSSLKKHSEERKIKEEEKKLKVEELPPLPSGPQPQPALPPTSQPDMRGPLPPQPPPPTPLPPPPMGMLPPPPFPLQPPGLLGPMGMSMPPGLVGPLGVPPPLMVPQQMIPRMPPPFNAPPQSFGLMDGMPPPPMPNAGNPFGPPMMPTVNNNNNNITNTSNKDPTEMDVVDESEEEMPKKDEMSVPLHNLPLPPSPFPGLPPLPLPSLGSNNREMPEPNSKKSEDTDMRMIEEQNRKRKWNGDDDGFRHRNNRWPERDRDRRGGGGSPLERRNDERPPLIPNTPVMPPDFPPFPNNNRHGGRGPDDEDVYPSAMIDFPPRDFSSRDFPRDFPPRGGANHFFSPRGPMFGPRGPPPPGHSPMNLRPPRHPGLPGLPGIRGNGEGRGGWCPPPPQQGPPPRGGRFPILHPPPLVPNRRIPGERKSRWGEPVEQPLDEMFPGQPDDMFLGPPEDMFPGPPRETPEDRLPERPKENFPAVASGPLGQEPMSLEDESKESKSLSEPPDNEASGAANNSSSSTSPPVDLFPEPNCSKESVSKSPSVSPKESSNENVSTDPPLTQATSPCPEPVEEHPLPNSDNVPSETFDMFSDPAPEFLSKSSEEKSSIVPESEKSEVSDDIFCDKEVDETAQIVTDSGPSKSPSPPPNPSEMFSAPSDDMFSEDRTDAPIDSDPSEVLPPAPISQETDPISSFSLYSPEPAVISESNDTVETSLVPAAEDNVPTGDVEEVHPKAEIEAPAESSSPAEQPNTSEAEENT